jgi:hypothetical protein
MTFHIYPDTPAGPLSVASGAKNPPISIAEPSGLAVGAIMFIRVAMSAQSCPTSSGTAPTVFLKAGAGLEKAVLLGGVTESYYNSATEIPANFVAAATMFTDLDNVFRVEVTLFKPGQNWQISIQNNDGSPRDFTWVVADSDADSKKPWISAPLSLDFDTLGEILIGDSIPNTLTVANKGTGPLQINDIVGVLGAGFKIVAPLPGAIPPNGCGDVKITFDAPATIGEKTFDYSIGSTDGVVSAGHKKTAHLKATVRKIEVVMVLDGSGSMAFTPDGTKNTSDPPSPIPVSESRWGRVEDAAEQFLDLLSTYAHDKGTIALVEFPDISLTPVPDISARVPQASIPIPTDVSALKALMKSPNPIPRAHIGNTPMGQGLAEAMGTADDLFGQFDSNGATKLTSKAINRRWLVMLSDGANNQGTLGSSNHPTYYYDPETSPHSFKGKNIKVFALAYGEKTAINWPADPDQMQTLATKSGGHFANPATEDIFKAFRNAITNGLVIDPVVDPGGTLTGNQPEVRHAVSVLPFDSRLSFVVTWKTFDAERISVALLTPNCELITPAVAKDDPNLSYASHPRYAIYSVEDAYLRNASEPDHPRYGTWTLIITGNGLEEGDHETFDFEVITQSRLKMQLGFDRPRYYAGDPIGLSARLTLDGKPIQNANVTWTLDAPGNSLHNWLAASKVTKAEYAKAAEEIAGADVTPLGIKTYALASKGVKFGVVSRGDTTTLNDPNKTGVYSATLNDTTMTGTYTFRVTALGLTEDGTQFRREQQVQVYLSVRPHPDFTLVDIEYVRVIIDGRPMLDSVVRILPRDPFGNVRLVDPEFNPSIALTAKGGEFTGPLVSNLDGSYTRTLRYAPTATPVIGLQIDGQEVIPSRAITPVAQLHYADQVVDFQIGLEAEEGANQHRDPQAALGDVTTKKQGEFVSLGAAGSLTVGVRAQFILAQGEDDVTVFVQPDEDLRRYSVEALPAGGGDNWVKLGTSPGVTQSFSLSKAKLTAAAAIRISDASGQMRGSTPGVSIRGIGFKKYGPAPVEPIGCLEQLLRLIGRLLGGRSK